MRRRKGVAVCIRDDKKRILLLKRGAGHRYTQTEGEWEQCGGEVNEGESFERAAARGVAEELGCEVELGKTLIHDDFSGMGDGIIWNVKVIEGRLVGDPKIMEPEKCVELKWFELSDLASLNLTRHTREDFEKLGWIENQIL